MKIKVCTYSKCLKNGGKDLYRDLNQFTRKVNKYIEKEGLDKKELKIKQTSCQHNCKHAPIVTIKDKQIEQASVKKIKEKILKKYGIKKDLFDL